TYRELDTHANRLGHALLALGLESQEPVGILSTNCIEMLITFFACAKAGLIYAPVNLGLKPDEIAYCLNDAGVRVLLIEDTLAQAAAPLAEQLPTLERIYWHGPQAQQHIHTTKSAGTFDALVASGHD